MKYLLLLLLASTTRAAPLVQPQDMSTLGFFNYQSTFTASTIGVSSNTPGYPFVVGKSTGVIVDQYGHFIYTGPVPTISSCGSTPSGSVVGTDQAGKITVGGGVVTACTLTFNQGAWPNAPICTAMDSSGTAVVFFTSVTSSAIVFGFSATIGSGQVMYHCVGWK